MNEETNSSMRQEKAPVLFHGTSSTRWASIQKDHTLKVAPFGDRHVSLTDDIEVARYWTRMACSADPGSTPVVLRIDTRGLPTERFSSEVWGEGECDWESETACLVDVPIDRIVVQETTPDKKDRTTRAVRYDKDTHRIQQGDDIVALAQRLSNNRWVLNDRNDQRMEKRTHSTPRQVARAYDEIMAGRPV